MKIKTLIAALALTAALTSAAVAPQMTAVYTPAVPQSVELCGGKIDLDRADLYERFDRELASIVYTHGTTMLILKRANRYFPEMAPILKANGVPSDLLYLSCVESSLNPRAYSPAKAAGFWQFIPSAAKEYGLEVNDEVDERYNIEKATAAAARYLKKSYARYGDWPSAMAAFNGGNARITRELDAQDQDSAVDLYLAEETTRYPFRIMAMKTVLENPAAYGFRLTANQLYQPRRYRTVTVSGPVADWPQWAKKQGISYAELRDANPWIRAKTLTNKSGKTYKVRIPEPESLRRSTAGIKIYNPRWVVQQ